MEPRLLGKPKVVPASFQEQMWRNHCLMGPSRWSVTGPFYSRMPLAAKSLRLQQILSRDSCEVKIYDSLRKLANSFGFRSGTRLTGFSVSDEDVFANKHGMSDYLLVGKSDSELNQITML